MTRATSHADRQLEADLRSTATAAPNGRAPGRTPAAAGASRELATPVAPAFLSLYDLGRSLVDTGRRTPTRQTLIRRGAEFAAKNGMTVHEVGRDRYVSSAELRRLHEAVAA